MIACIAVVSDGTKLSKFDIIKGQSINALIKFYTKFFLTVYLAATNQKGVEYLPFS